MRFEMRSPGLEADMVIVFRSFVAEFADGGASSGRGALAMGSKRSIARDVRRREARGR